MTERSHYIQEIDALRIQAARTEILEAENRKLNAELGEARQRHEKRSNVDGRGDHSAAGQGSSSETHAQTENLTVDIEEYNRVKEDLLKVESDYGKLVWARDHLETKVREQKGTLRQWKEYRKSWILKYPNKRFDHLRSSSAKASPLATPEHCRSSSTPAPPALPEGLTPSFSGVNISPSPSQNSRADPKAAGCPLDRGFEHHDGYQTPLSDKTDISQAGHNIANASDSGDVTEATPESEEQGEPFKIEPPAGSSSPIIVFERSLKRRHSKRGGAKNTLVHEADQGCQGAAPRTIPPKSEQISSPITALPVPHSDGPFDSLDLDDVGGHLDTPRKRLRTKQERLRSSMTLPLTAQQDEEDILDHVTAAVNPRQLDDVHLDDGGERDNQATLSMILPEKNVDEEKVNRRDARVVRQHAHNDRIHQRLEAGERRNPMFDPPMPATPTPNELAQRPNTHNDSREVRQRNISSASSAILQPRNVNTPVLPRTSDPFANRKQPGPSSRRDRGSAHVSVLAEDGERLSSNGDTLRARKRSLDDVNNPQEPAHEESKAPPTHHRLGALLTKPSPEKTLLMPGGPVAGVSPDQLRSETPIARSAYQHESKGPATPRSLPAKRAKLNHGSECGSGPPHLKLSDASTDRYSKSVQAVSKRPKIVPAFRKSPPVEFSETRPEHEPLRARPVHRLGLQDFKFNPAHSDFAYHELVRRHDEKKSLSGCTDSHCFRCKGLRQFVIDSGYRTAQKPGESGDEADWRLMQGFLGDNHRQLRSMATKERSDLLIEAKVKEFANIYGCHRQAFPRAREAPGLWEVDFPTTQEEAENRAAADVLEREKVQERYWEATRPKGKWMFADE